MKELLQNILSQDAYWMVNKKIARAVGLDAAVLLSDLISKEKYFEKAGKIDDSGFFYNKQSNIEIDTTLSPHQQRKAFKKLNNLELVETQLKGVPAKNYYKINHKNILKILSDLKEFNSQMLKNLRSRDKNIKLLYTNNNKINNNKVNNNSNFTFQKKVNKDFPEKNPELFKNIDGIKTFNEFILHCMNIHYNNLKIRSKRIKRESYFSEKEINKNKKIIRYYLKGFPYNQYSSLKTYINEYYPEKKEILKRGMSIEKFTKLLKKSCSVYRPEFEPEIKKHLPNRLSDFLYNRFGKIKSYFCFYGFGDISGILEEQPLNDEYKEYTKLYFDFFENKLNISEKNQVVKFVRKIVKEHKDICSRKIIFKDKKYIREQVEDHKFALYFSEKNFIKEHIAFLESFDYNSEFQKNIGHIKIDGWFWRKFKIWYKEKFGIEFYPDQKKLKMKVKKSIGKEKSIYN